MGAGHGHLLYRHGRSPLHALPPQCKIAAQLGFVLAVVATPREAFWAFGVYAAVVGSLAAVAGLPLRFMLTRMTVETPFVLFALFLPFIGGGPRTEVAGLSLSVEGLWAAWNIGAKATIGVGATLVVAGTTSVAELLSGLERLRLPQPLVAIAAFMVRYGEVVASEMRRMDIARRSRGHDPRWLWQARAVAASAGALFIRSYERGERVWLAMRSRGYDGRAPLLARDAAAASQWALALTVPAAAALVAISAWTVAR
ncbi:MAG TPA: cobalt ECF transporter T component CbiQ [Actinomycetota bacterium]|nr:cobalt ECF transporter T component CbiQ [Actinomycetota bacterium]